VIPVNKIKQIVTLSLSSRPRLVVMSDMHRGDGSGADDFAHNSLLYKCALEYYLDNGFTCVELGDAEELWENKTFVQIYITHTSVYDLLRRFHHPDPEKTRYIKIWGNHDLEWENSRDVDTTLAGLFPGIRLYEAALLDGRVLLWHGHQADPHCTGSGGSVSKFFVRHFWPPLQRAGIKDPTRAAVNPGICNEVDRTLYGWAKNNTKGIDTIIAGHTHRPVYENLSLTEKRYLSSGIEIEGIPKKTPDAAYYNTGSCVHPRCITGIEITEGSDHAPAFKLIKWAYSIRGDSDRGTDLEPEPAYTDRYTLTVQRIVLEG
jgi:UDP-2,3-diacylglucosamine pyrophosphatase LpxH